MPIEFLDLLDADDAAAWEPWPVAGDPARWRCEGDAWRSTKIDPSFGLTGLRLAPGTTVPPHRHNRSLLVLVFRGTLEVTHRETGDPTASPDETARLRAGQFCVIDAETEHRLTAGPDGTTILTSWPLRAPELVTTWESAGRSYGALGT